MEDSEGLHDIAGVVDLSREADIVFVHGIPGGSHVTWRYDDAQGRLKFFWPAEMSKDLRHCGVWSFGYPAAIAALNMVGTTIPAAAVDLAQRILHVGLGRRPLVFIAHGAGGLVVKSLLAGDLPVSVPDRERLVGLTTAVVFCATPHRGFDLAFAANKLRTYFGQSPATVELSQADTEAIDTLHRQFVDWQRRGAVPLCSYTENTSLRRRRRLLPSVSIGFAVPPDCADPQIEGHSVQAAEGDHFTCVQPTGRESRIYVGVLQFISELVTQEYAQQRSGRYSSVVGTCRLLAALPGNQRDVVRMVAIEEELHVSELAEALHITQNEALQRVRTLVRHDLLRTGSLSDLSVFLSDRSMMALSTAWSEFYNALKH